MIESLKQLISQLLDLTPAVYHDEAAPDHPDQYIVWSIDGGETFYADQTAAETSLEISVDLFTGKEFDPLADQVQETFGLCQVAWYINSVQYERDTGLTHWEWVVQCG